MATITLQSVMEQAQLVHRSLSERFDMVTAKENTNDLYQIGIKLVHAEAENTPYFKDIVSPVVIELNKVVTLNTLQHQREIHLPLSKAHRVFSDLIWFQCSKQRSLPVFTETRDELISATKKITKTFPGEVYLKFEYSCARQAAKCLTPSENIWNKYIDHALEIGSNAESLSFFGTLKSAKDLLAEAEKDWVKEWYPDVQYLRWVSIQVKNKSDFETIIEPQVNPFGEKGKKRSICLAVVCIELIEKQGVSIEVKEKAVDCLIELYKREDTDRMSRFLNRVEKSAEKHKMVRLLLNKAMMKKMIEKEDRYYLTRKLIISYIEEIAKNSDNKQFVEKLKNELLDKNNIKEINKKDLSSKSENISKTKNELLTKKKENILSLNDAREDLKPQRGEDELTDSQRKEIEDEIQEIEKENHKINEEIEYIDCLNEAIDCLSDVLNELNQEEKEHIEQVSQAITD